MITPTTGEAFLKLRLKDQAAAIKLLDDDPNLKGKGFAKSRACLLLCATVQDGTAAGISSGAALVLVYAWHHHQHSQLSLSCSLFMSMK